MAILNALLRYYAYLYHFLSAAFLAGLGLVAYLTGVHNLNTGGMMKLSGVQLSQCLIGIGVTGIVVVVLAVLGRFRFLFPIYATLAAFTMFRWFFASGYSFGTKEAFQGGLLYFAGAAGAMLCSFLDLRSSKAGK
jgi:hypothetical protein